MPAADIDTSLASPTHADDTAARKTSGGFRRTPLWARWSLGLVVALAFLVRVYQLDTLPLNFDEYQDTIRGNELISQGKAETFLRIPVTIYGGKIPVLYNALSMATQAFFDAPEYVARLPAIACGTLSVAFVFVLAMLLYGSPGMAIVAAIISALLPWHIVMSRIGLKTALVPLAGPVIVWAVVRGLAHSNRLAFLASTALLSLGTLYNYTGAYPLLLVYAVAVFVYRDSPLLSQKRLLAGGGVLFCTVSAPLLWLMAGNGVQSLSYNAIGAGGDASAVHFASTFASNLVASARLLFWSEGPLALFAPSVRSPLLLSWLALPLLLAAMAIAAVARTGGDILLLAWMGLAIAVPCAAIGGNFEPRYILLASVPMILLFARGIDALWSRAGAVSNARGRIALRLCAVTVLALAILPATATTSSYYVHMGSSWDDALMYSAGCRQSAAYLASVPTAGKASVVTDFRMVIPPYYNYVRDRFWAVGDGRSEPLFLEMNSEEAPWGTMALEDFEHSLLHESVSIYYILWSPSSFDTDDGGWMSSFRRVYAEFRRVHPEAKPCACIPRPGTGGVSMVEVFRIDRTADIVETRTGKEANVSVSASSCP